MNLLDSQHADELAALWGRLFPALRRRDHLIT